MISLEKPPLNELAHFGVLGMKWGVRKQDQNTSNPKMKTSTKIAIGVGVAASVAIGAYFIHRYVQMNGNAVIKTGKEFQRMSSVVDKTFDKPFYASHLKTDNKAYLKNNLFGTNWKYKQTLEASSNIRIAGQRDSYKIFKDWLSTNEEAKTKIKDNSKRAYDLFNRNFNSPDIRDQSLRNSYLTKLSESGFAAIRDRNDQLFSNKRSPILIFGNVGNVSIKSFMELSS